MRGHRQNPYTHSRGRNYSPSHINQDRSQNDSMTKAFPKPCQNFSQANPFQDSGKKFSSNNPFHSVGSSFSPNSSQGKGQFPSPNQQRPQFQSPANYSPRTPARRYQSSPAAVFQNEFTVSSFLFHVICILFVLINFCDLNIVNKFMNYSLSVFLDF